MDDRLKAALDQANYSTSIQLQRKNYQLRYENALIYAIHGGTFVANPSLISFVDTLLHRNIDSSVILDSRNNPIMIEDLKGFASKLIDINQRASNEFFTAMEKLRKARTTKASVGL